MVSDAGTSYICRMGPVDALTAKGPSSDSTRRIRVQIMTMDDFQKNIYTFRKGDYFTPQVLPTRYIAWYTAKLDHSNGEAKKQ